ncbi:MAG TPA: DUF433 domain-containing protein [Chthoniobacterales bacterium]|jgi:uncharacterized protein (DUF433 family)|nr:DUF433 domain-containing protein [Chthoniobacterales bacterium]
MLESSAATELKFSDRQRDSDGQRSISGAETPFGDMMAPGNTMNFTNYFQRDPQICGGETVLKGTRVPLRTVLARLAEGYSFDEILQDFPSLFEEQLRVVVAFAATSAKEDLPVQTAASINEAQAG